MSDHAHAGAAEAHADHHAVYDGKPANEPGPGEPATPGWFTLLGITLVLALMLAWVATRPDGKTRAELTPSSSASAVAAAAKASAPRPERPARPAPPTARPGMPPTGLPNRFLPRPAPSGATGARPLRPVRPGGEFAVRPGDAANPASAIQRRPRPSAPQ
jgi:fermentation-respiration switch protein FrsA (DUF1100 family)